jgi:hypothetical protein
VVRIFHNGFAVQFIEMQRISDLTRLVSRNAAPGRAVHIDEPEETPA